MPNHLIPWDSSPRIKLSGVMLKTNLHFICWESVEFYLHSPLHALDAELKGTDNIYNFNFEVLTVLFMKFQYSGIWRHNRRLGRTCFFYPKDSRRRVSCSFFMGYPRCRWQASMNLGKLHQCTGWKLCFFNDVNRLQIIMHYVYSLLNWIYILNTDICLVIITTNDHTTVKYVTDNLYV